jgi:hypothetical protein
MNWGFAWDEKRLKLAISDNKRTLAEKSAEK